MLLLSFYCMSVYICRSGGVIPCTVAELWNCGPPQELQPPYTAKHKDDPYFKQLMLHHFSCSTPLSFLCLVSNEPLNLPALVPPCRHWKGLSPTKATVSEGLFSFTLGGTICSVTPYEAHPPPGIARCDDRVCPFPCPRVVDKLLCLDTEPQGWHTLALSCSLHIFKSVPTWLRRAVCLRGRNSCSLLESLDFWRTNVTSSVGLVFGLTNLTSHRGLWCEAHPLVHLS